MIDKILVLQLIVNNLSGTNKSAASSVPLRHQTQREIRNKNITEGGNDKATKSRGGAAGQWDSKVDRGRTGEH